MNRKTKAIRKGAKVIQKAKKSQKLKIRATKNIKIKKIKTKAKAIKIKIPRTTHINKDIKKKINTYKTNKYKIKNKEFKIKSKQLKTKILPIASPKTAITKPNILEVKQKINNLENKDLNTYILNLETKHTGRGRKKKQNTSIPKPQEAEESINKILNNANSADYLIKNVSKKAVDVLHLLVNPMTDEQISFQLDMKINSIRRILNILQGYGLTKYYVAKNSNGWLSFAWYINTTKLDYFFDYIKQGNSTFLKEDCNDYFICNKCYKDNNLVLTFNEAFDNEFKCNTCGKQYSRIDRLETEKLIKE